MQVSSAITPNLSIPDKQNRNGQKQYKLYFVVDINA